MTSDAAATADDAEHAAATADDAEHAAHPGTAQSEPGDTSHRQQPEHHPEANPR